VPKLTALHKWLNYKEDLNDEMRQCVTTVEGVDLVSTARVTPHRATIDDDDVQEIFR
jgi:hypothetical protein